MSQIRLASTVAALLLASAGAASAAPAAGPGGITAPARTSISLSTPLGAVGTPNRHESRPALSEVKLLMADWVLNRGDGSARDRLLCERMIRVSDDAAAQELWNKYGPVTISSPAAHYGLTSTRLGANWGNSRTSAADLTQFLDAKRINDPGSPILHWMRTAEPVAADGTHQNWGTDRLSGVEGTKWGWSDFGPSVVATASFGRDFSVAAITHGTPAEQNADLAGALVDVPADVPADAPAQPMLVTGSVEVPLPAGVEVPHEIAGHLPVHLPAPVPPPVPPLPLPLSQALAAAGIPSQS